MRGSTLVTGASGFIGYWVVRTLVEQGERVRALVRPGSVPDHLRALDVDICPGDLRDTPSLAAAIQGCECLYHVGALHANWLPDPQEFYTVNVTGTRNLMELALAERVARVVYTSTNNTIGVPRNSNVATEDDEFNWWRQADAYTRSKYLAEREVLSFCDRGLPAVVLNPGAPVGAFDTKPTPTGRLIVHFLRRKIPAYLDGMFNLIDVRDVAAAHVQAARKGRPGQRYIIGGQNLRFRELFALLERISGVPSPRLVVPNSVAWLLAITCKWAVCPLTKRPPLVSTTTVFRSKNPVHLDSSKAVRELGLRQTPVEVPLQAAMDWFHANGYA